MTGRNATYPLLRLALSVGVAVPAHATLTWTSMAVLMGTFHKQIYVVGDPLSIAMVCGLSILVAYSIGRLFCRINPDRARQAAIVTACLLPLAYAMLYWFAIYFWSVPNETPSFSDEIPISFTPYIPHIVGYFAAAASGLLLATWRSPRSVPPIAPPGASP